MRRKTRKIRNYSPKQMEDALEDIRKGYSVASAAKMHGIPRITLLYNANGKTKKSRMGPNPILSLDEEEILVNWIKSLAKAGFPIAKGELINSAKQLLVKLNRTSQLKSGQRWFQSFLDRHPSISLRSSENLTSRSSVSTENVRSWYQEVHSYLSAEGVLDVLEHPARVFSSDETGIFLNPKGNKILAMRGDKKVYQKVHSDENECLTVMITANAAGVLTPPLIVFKYDNVPEQVAASIPSDWGVGRSEKGWVTGPLFYDFVSNIFYPWLITEHIKLPVLFFVNSHSSRMTLHTSEFCAEKGIILIALHPNSTHLIQPMDVSVFRLLKDRWKQKIHSRRMENVDLPILKKKDFAPILKDVLTEIPKTAIQDGFRECGIVPWNPCAVIDTSFPSSNEIVNLTSENETEYYKIALEVTENFIGAERLVKFQTATEWTGEVEDTSLYYVWRKIKSCLDMTKFPKLRNSRLTEQGQWPEPSIKETVKHSSNCEHNNQQNS